VAASFKRPHNVTPGLTDQSREKPAQKRSSHTEPKPTEKRIKSFQRPTSVPTNPKKNTINTRALRGITEINNCGKNICLVERRMLFENMSITQGKVRVPRARPALSRLLVIAILNAITEEDCEDCSHHDFHVEKK
jgi:hypothetical protein